MNDYSWQINRVRGKLDDGGFDVTRIKNKLGDLENDIIDAIKADTMKFSTGDLNELEPKEPGSDGDLSSADDNLYRELDELQAAIIEEEMKRLQELVNI